MKIKINELMVLGHKAVKSFGYSDSETQMILDVLMYAQLRGNNQGLVKLIGQGIPKDPRASAIRVIKETQFSVLLDGAYNMAIIVANRAVQIALGKATEPPSPQKDKSFVGNSTLSTSVNTCQHCVNT